MKVIDGISENYLEIVESLRTGIILLDTKDDYFYMNISARDILGSTNIVKKLQHLDFAETNLQTYIDNVRNDKNPITLRDLKFKNFDKVEKICDCSISSFINFERQFILLEFNETGRLYNISNEKNLISRRALQRLVLTIKILLINKKQPQKWSKDYRTKLKILWEE